MDTIGILFDAIKFAAGAGLCYFVFYLWLRVFNGGVMASGFRMIALSTVFLCIGRLTDLLTNFTPILNSGSMTDLGDVLGTIFALLNAYGFYQIYKVWKIGKKESVVTPQIDAQSH